MGRRRPVVEMERLKLVHLCHVNVRDISNNVAAAGPGEGDGGGGDGRGEDEERGRVTAEI